MEVQLSDKGLIEYIDILFSNRMEALLSDEGLLEDSKKFEASVRNLTLREYDYLDFR